MPPARILVDDQHKEAFSILYLNMADKGYQPRIKDRPVPTKVKRMEKGVGKNLKPDQGICALILTGQGTRMKSDRAKVYMRLLETFGQLSHYSGSTFGADPVVVVVGHQRGGVGGGPRLQPPSKKKHL